MSVAKMAPKLAEFGKVLSNFVACEGFYVLTSWWVGRLMEFRPESDLQIGILVRASSVIPWIFAGGYLLWFLLSSKARSRFSFASWFLPGFVIGAAFVFFESSLLYW